MRRGLYSFLLILVGSLAFLRHLGAHGAFPKLSSPQPRCTVERGVWTLVAYVGILNPLAMAPVDHFEPALYL